MKPSPTNSRAAALNIHYQVVSATRQLRVSIHSTEGASPQQVREWLDLGADITTLEPRDWNSVFSSWSLASVDVLLSVFNELSVQTARSVLLSACHFGSSDSVESVLYSAQRKGFSFIDDGTSHSALRAALVRDDLSMIRVLRDASVAKMAVEFNSKESLIGHIKSAEALHEMLPEGIFLSRPDAFMAVFLGKTHPHGQENYGIANPDLLLAFMEAGVDFSPIPAGPCPWSMLLSRGSPLPEYRANQVACARILLDAGIKIRAELAPPNLPAILVLLDAGFDPDETLSLGANWTRLRDVFHHDNTAMTNSDPVIFESITGLLQEASLKGYDIQKMFDANPPTNPPNLVMAFVAAGVSIGNSIHADKISEDIFARGEEFNLLKNTPKALASRPASRL